MIKRLDTVVAYCQEHRDLLLLLLIGGLYSLGIFLSNTFVNVYLWKQSGDYMTIAMYNLAIYLFQPLTFILAGRLAKKVDRVIVLRLGVIFLSIFFLSVLLIGEKAATYNFIIGSLLGVGYGFYWLAYNVLTFEITEPETRDFFNGMLGILQSFGGMLGPFIAGYIISRMEANIGYSVIFTISFILFIAAVVTSFFLVRRPAEGNFYFKKILKERRFNKNWGHILHAHVFQGLREGIFSFIITIWVYILTQSEMSLGTFNLLLSGLSFVFYFLASKFIKETMRKKAILLGGVMLYLAVFIILFEITFTHLIIYAIVIGIAYPIINVPYVSLTYDVIGKAKAAASLRVEYIVVRELFVNLGRVLSITVFLLAVFFFSAEAIIPYLLAIFGMGHLLMSLFIRKIHFIPPDQEDDEYEFEDHISNEKNR